MFTITVRCSFHDRVNDVNMDWSGLRELFLKHILPLSLKFLLNRTVNGLEAVKPQFRIII